MDYSNSNISITENQDYLQKWDKHKAENQRLAQRFKKLGWYPAVGNLGERMDLCSHMLVFSVNDSGERRLRNAAYCRARLCPVCQWRRSLKVRGQMTQVLEHVESTRGLRYIMLTLTLQNCEVRDLRTTVKAMFKGWSNMTRKVWFKNICVGSYRALEVSINPDDQSCHPHIHAVLAVKPSYFTGRSYIKTEEWAQRWQEALELPYTPVVHTAALRKPYEKSAAEIAKYSLKVGNLIELLNDLSDDFLIQLHNGLSGWRLFSLAGVFRDAHKELHLSEMDDPAAEGESGLENVPLEEQLIFWYWNPGINRYTP